MPNINAYVALDHPIIQVHTGQAEVLELRASAPSQRHTDLITIYSTLLAAEYARNGAFSEATASVALSAAKSALRIVTQEINPHA